MLRKFAFPKYDPSLDKKISDIANLFPNELKDLEFHDYEVPRSKGDPPGRKFHVFGAIYLFVDDSQQKKSTGIGLGGSKKSKLRAKTAFKKKLRSDLLPSVKGEKVYAEALNAAISAMRYMMQGKNVGLHGLVQSGKTTSQVLVATIFPIVFATFHDNFQYIPFVILPNLNKYRRQFISKSNELIRNCYGKITLQYRRNLYSLKEQFEATKAEQSKFFHKLRMEVEDFRSIDKVNNLDCDLHTILINPSGKKCLDAIIQYMEKEENRSFLFLMDEFHWGKAEGSQTDDLFKGGFQNQPLYNSVKKQAVKSPLLVATSATNFDAANGAMHEHVKIKQGIGYHGPTKGYSGSSLLDTEPNVVLIDDYFPDVNLIKWNLYKDKLAFEKLKKKKPELDIFPDHESYKSFCNTETANFIDWVYSVYMPTARPDKVGRAGMLLRITCNNALATEFRNSPEFKEVEEKHNLVVIEDYGQDSGLTSEELIEKYTRGEDINYLYLVTAKARMSESFPVSTCLGADLARASSTRATALQGIPGRLFGYYKQGSTIFLLREYFEKTKNSRKPTYTSIESGPRKAQRYVSINRIEHEVYCSKLEDVINRNAGEFKLYVRSNVPQIRLGGKNKSDLIKLKNVISDQVISLLNKDKKVKILGWGDSTNTRKYTMTSAGNPLLTSRSIREDNKRGGAADGSRVMIRYDILDWKRMKEKEIKSPAGKSWYIEIHSIELIADDRTTAWTTVEQVKGTVGHTMSN